MLLSSVEELVRALPEWFPFEIFQLVAPLEMFQLVAPRESF